MLLISVPYDGRTTKRLIQSLIHTPGIEYIERINYAKRYMKGEKSSLIKQERKLLFVACALEQQTAIDKKCRDFHVKYYKNTTAPAYEVTITHLA